MSLYSSSEDILKAIQQVPAVKVKITSNVHVEPSVPLAHFPRKINSLASPLVLRYFTERKFSIEVTNFNETLFSV